MLQTSVIGLIWSIFQPSMSE